jgi:hypothetical protein
VPKAHHHMLCPWSVGIYESPLPINLRRWSWWRMLRRCIVGDIVRGRFR